MHVWCSMMEQHNIKWKLICGCSGALITIHQAIYLSLSWLLNKRYEKNSEAVYIFTSISWHSFNKAYIDSEKSLAVFVRLLNGPTRPCNIVYDYALHNFMHIFSSFASHPFYHVYCSIQLHFFYSSALQFKYPWKF